MATIKEVAEQAGVSPATVSRVLTGTSGERSEARERVLRVVADLDYQPNRLASNLRRRTRETLGVVVSDIENPHFTQMVRAVEDAAHAHGFRVLLCNTDETPGKQRAYLEIIAAERVQGVILTTSDPPGEEIGRVLDRGIPVVAFDRTVVDPRADAVVVDNVEGTRRATDLLVGAGHERVGFVGGRSTLQTGAERAAGYEVAKRRSGLAPRAADGDFRLEGGRQAAAALLAGGGPTALVVANHLMTVGALQAIRDRGLQVPADLALVALDDPFWAELVEPPLTTLAQPVRRMADGAVRLLFERIGGTRQRARCLVFDFELRVRRSCGTAVAEGGDG